MSINVKTAGQTLSASDWTSVITTVENTTSGHSHNGIDSRYLDGITLTSGVGSNNADGTAPMGSNWDGEIFFKSNSNYLASIGRNSNVSGRWFTQFGSGAKTAFTPPSRNKWHFLQLTCDLTTAKAFCDGELVGSSAMTTGGNRVGLYIGGSVDSSYFEDIYFTGSSQTKSDTGDKAVDGSSPANNDRLSGHGWTSESGSTNSFYYSNLESLTGSLSIRVTSGSGDESTYFGVNVGGWTIGAFYRENLSISTQNVVSNSFTDPSITTKSVFIAQGWNATTASQQRIVVSNSFNSAIIEVTGKGMQEFAIFSDPSNSNFAVVTARSQNTSSITNSMIKANLYTNGWITNSFSIVYQSVPAENVIAKIWRI